MAEEIDRYYYERTAAEHGFECVCGIDEAGRGPLAGPVFAAMRRAFEALPERPQAAFVDGNRLPVLPVPSKAIIKGDSLSASIAAASIMAKVSRDRYMLSLDKQYPEYCFKKHKGYGTKLHYEKIREFGISPVHRKTFLKKLPEGW